MIRNPQINWSYFMTPFIKLKAWWKRQSWLHIHGLNTDRHKMRGLNVKLPNGGTISIPSGTHPLGETQYLKEGLCGEMSWETPFFNVKKVDLQFTDNNEVKAVDSPTGKYNVIDEMWKEV